MRGVQSAKIYQVGKEYRRVADGFTRSITEERMKCHFSVVGAPDGLLAEAEMLRVTMEVLDGLKLGAYTIKINHSLILRGLLEECQVPEKLWRRLAKSINNISKVYLTPRNAVGIYGPPRTLSHLLEDHFLTTHKDILGRGIPRDDYKFGASEGNS